MVAVRSLPDPLEPPPGRRVTGSADPIVELADRWAELLAAGQTCLPRRLDALLRRLSVALRAEPFWPLAVRPLGAALLDAGLAGRRAGADAPPPEDLLPLSLGLLRRDGQRLLDLPGPEGARRLATALDELVAGFTAAVRKRSQLAAPPEEQLERVLADGELRYRTLYLQGPVGIGIGDLDGQVLDMNPALCRMFGLSAPPDLPRPVTDFVHPDDAAGFIESYHRLRADDGPDTLGVDVRLVRGDELVVWVHITGSLVRDDAGRPSHLIAVVQDVSERHRLRSRLEQASSQDRLTRLPNRVVTEQRLRQAFLPGAARRVGLCALDIDGFTKVNDGLGHQIGDQLLLAVAGRLQMAAGPHLVTRTGGDEFAVLVVDPEGLDDVCRLADRLLAALAAPFHLGGHTLMMSASVGVTEAATTAACPDELRRAADVALSWAKAHGGGERVVFDPERDAGEAARFALLAGLRGAVERAEFHLAFQPLVRLHDRWVRGAEALVRWQHPDQGLLGPGRFIELAERSGAIIPLGHWVLAEACRTAAAWRAELGHGSPYVSVNVSPLQLTESEWVQEVIGVLDETGLPAEKLQLEITEQAVLGDEAVALDALDALRAVGVRLALDDFGTGYSSLAWLRRLPVHALKIDGSFIDGLRHPLPDPVDQSIVRALVEMAHALGLEVTAEWVETRVQADRLCRLGCDLGQGRWFGDAGPASWVPELWRRTIR
ncbi:putative bifunctional diguanylate cyclase/phosphodiesterase [Pseudonocardia asaccharolytica]|uniref:GGDEF domain-containing protein n=1 Tax=Pseudonocardia asaccharolytica DSM 44247 = NBRC 16224 TaxID=1123024 RepID=A0A511D0A8_9PSEU|nr:EAL domain-containing protein [Pseudonocardia asaccharolytica]GEL18220.1 GGDEF domain-containing protein [Pseudonocardia asaccharolytica DSM 44247 = NBRC 16224]